MGERIPVRPFVSDGKDRCIRELRAERDALREALRYIADGVDNPRAVAWGALGEDRPE